MAKLTSGKSLSEKEFQEELKKLNKLEQDKVSIKLLGKQTTSEEVLNMLKEHDTVDIVLNDDTVLRVSKNGKYWYGERLFGFSPTSDEEGFTVDDKTKQKISVNYTAKQQIAKVIDFYLGRLK